LKDHYPRDIFDYIWVDLRNLVEAGLMRSPEEVFIECQRGTDGLEKTLLTEFPQLFVPITNDFLKAVASVRIACPTLQDINSIKNSGDLHVVALALVLQATVISNESPAKSPNDRQKIPDACNTLNLRHLNWHDFLRERKAAGVF
jgi:hypothetical protein